MLLQVPSQKPVIKGSGYYYSVYDLVVAQGYQKFCQAT